MSNTVANNYLRWVQLPSWEYLYSWSRQFSHPTIWFIWNKLTTCKELLWLCNRVKYFTAISKSFDLVFLKVSYPLIQKSNFGMFPGGKSALNFLPQKLCFKEQKRVVHCLSLLQAFPHVAHHQHIFYSRHPQPPSCQGQMFTKQTESWTKLCRYQ